MKKYRLFLPLIILSSLLFGCGDKKEEVTGEDTQAVISVGDYDTTAPTTYTQITSVNGYCFPVRDRDLNGDFNTDPLYILNTSKSPKYVFDDDYEFNSLFPADGNILVNTEDEYTLYKPGECLYSIKVNGINDLSLLYYTEDVAGDEFSLFLKDYGITDAEFIKDSYKTTADMETGFYECFEKFTFTMDDTDFKGFIYGVETDEGQTFFVTGGNVNHFSEEELDCIAAGFGTNGERTELAADSGITRISYDLNGVLLTGAFPDVLGLVSDLGSYRYADTDFLDKEPYYANPYFSCLAKYNVYTVYENTGIADFLELYPDIFPYADQSAILDESEGEWYVFDKEENSDFGTKTALAVKMFNDECIVFQIWYENDEIRQSLINGLSSVTTDLGETTQGDVCEYMKGIYESKHPDIATSTDAAIGVNLKHSDKNSPNL